MSAQPVIEVEQIDVFYGTSQILFGVSLSVNQGQTVALLGERPTAKALGIGVSAIARCGIGRFA